MNGALNRLNINTVAITAKMLMRCNLIRLRGVFAKAILRAQLGSPGMSSVFAALVAVLGSRLPVVAQLVVARLVAQWRAAYSNQDRVLCFATARFLAHLFNQQVITELLLLELLSTCLLDPSDGSVELAVVTLGECTVLLSEKSPKAVEVVFQRLRDVLHDGELSRRVQVLIGEVMDKRRKQLDADVLEQSLDMLEEEDVITHFVSLEENEELDLQYECNAFHFDPKYEENERIYEQIKRDILGADASEPPITEPFSNDPDEAAQGNNESLKNVTLTASGKDLQVPLKTTDMTESDLIDFRRTVYLTTMSGLTYEEWAHKLLRLMKKHPGKELHLCQMIIECCSQEKTFYSSYGLLAQRFCLINKTYVSKFEELFASQYGTIHRLDTRKIRNIASLYASLLASDVLPWSLFELVRIVEEETTSSSRIFLKILFQEIHKTLGAKALKEKILAVEEGGHLNGVFPTDTADNARFSINFFTSIGLGNLTDDLREKLKTIPVNLPEVTGADDGASASSSSLSSSSLSSSSLSSSSGSEGHPDAREETSHRDEDSAMGKRDQSQLSVAPSDRPAKARRRGLDSGSYQASGKPRSPSVSREESEEHSPVYRSNERRRGSQERSEELRHLPPSSEARPETARSADKMRRELGQREEEMRRRRKSSRDSDRRGWERRRSSRASRRRSRRRYDYSSDESDDDNRGRRRGGERSESDDEYRRERRYHDSDDDSYERRHDRSRRYRDNEDREDRAYRRERSRSRYR